MLALTKWHPINNGIDGGILALCAVAGIRPHCTEFDSRGSDPTCWDAAAIAASIPEHASAAVASGELKEIDPLYLFVCLIEWEKREDTAGAWELIAAAQSSHSDSRANARALLTASRHFEGGAAGVAEQAHRQKRLPAEEDNMKIPYGTEVGDEFTVASYAKHGFFCGFAEPVLRALDHASHKSTVPAGAILFVEGQNARGMFILCSGRVKLSTTSREGKILVLKMVEAGEAVGLSAAISGLGFEMTAETATPCQLTFIDRKNLLNLLENYSEFGMHAAQSLSRDFRCAYRDIHDLVLTRSSAGKLARLLLSHSPDPDALENFELEPRFPMTHEEMAQRIGASRETVTRLLSGLKRKRLIGLDGPNLVIRDRTALEALAV